MKQQEILQKYKDHFFISYKNMGGSKKLVGNVAVVVFFVDDTKSDWTAAEKEDYKKTMKEAMRFLIKTAEKRNIPLKIKTLYTESTVSADGIPNNYYTWTSEAIKKYGKKSISEFQTYVKEKYGFDEAPVLFVFDKKFRSGAVAVNARTSQYDELGIISDTCDAGAVIHELLHQFGGRDLYFPRELRNFVKSLNYPSIMLDSNTLVIDSLTSYLIGWSDEMDDRAVQILEKTKHYTLELFNELVRREWEE